MANLHSSHDGEPLPLSVPSHGIRTTWTLLLIVHLVAIILAVQSNTLPVSPLRAKLGDTPLHLYLNALHMNQGYAYHLTDGAALDFDHSIEIELTPDTNGAKAGEDSEESAILLTLPDEALWPDTRKRRFQNLALAVGDRAEGDPTFAALLPGDVAKGMLGRAGITSGTHRFRCLRQQNVILENTNHPDRALSDPYHTDRFQTAYEASLICDGGHVDIVKIVSESERAAVRRSQKNDGIKNDASGDR